MAIENLSPRTDDIGLLAQRLIGNPEDGVDPDPSAALPLLDALQQAGASWDANALHRMLFRMSVWGGEARNVHERIQFLRRFHNECLDVVGHLRYDVTSVVMELSRLAQPIKDSPLEASEARVSTFRVHLEWPAAVGDGVVLPDGRSGVVIRGSDENGYVDVVLSDAARAPGGSVGTYVPSDSTYNSIPVSAFRRTR